jgi:hypothetical protein
VQIPGQFSSLNGLPGLALVGAALEKHIDVTGVAPASLAALGKGQERTAGGHQQRGNAIGVIAALTGDEDVGGRKQS